MTTTAALAREREARARAVLAHVERRTGARSLTPERSESASLPETLRPSTTSPAERVVTGVLGDLERPPLPTPPELEESNQERIVGLTIGLDPLIEIRKARLKQLGMSVDANYGLKDQVKAELEYAREIFAQHPQWPALLRGLVESGRVRRLRIESIDADPAAVSAHSDALRGAGFADGYKGLSFGG